jgi:hypothetical protein
MPDRSTNPCGTTFGSESARSRIRAARAASVPSPTMSKVAKGQRSATSIASSGCFSWSNRPIQRTRGALRGRDTEPGGSPSGTGTPQLRTTTASRPKLARISSCCWCVWTKTRSARRSP